MTRIRPSRIRKQLSARRREIESNLESALLENQEPVVVSQLADALKAAREAEQRFARPRLRMLSLGLFLAFVVLSLIGIVVSSRLPIATVHLDALSTALIVEAADRGALGSKRSSPLTSMDGFLVNSLVIERVSGDSTSEVVEHDGDGVARIEVHEDTRIGMWYEKPDCISMKVLKPRASGEDTGVIVTLAPHSGENANNANLNQHVLGTGSEMSFCAPKDIRPFLFGPTAALSLTREYEIDNLKTTASSIVAGMVEISGTSVSRRLTPNDRVNLDKLDRAWLVLHRDSGGISSVVVRQSHRR